MTRLFDILDFDLSIRGEWQSIIYCLAKILSLPIANTLSFFCSFVSIKRSITYPQTYRQTASRPEPTPTPTSTATTRVPAKPTSTTAAPPAATATTTTTQPAAAASPRDTIFPLLVSELIKENIIRPDDGSRLRNLYSVKDAVISAALDVYDLDSDIGELVDTLQRRLLAAQ